MSMSAPSPARYSSAAILLHWLLAALLMFQLALGWRLEEDAEAAAGHRLVLFAESASQPEDAASADGGGVRYHRSDATEARDSVQGIGLQRRIGADRMSVLGTDYKTMQAVTAQLPLQRAGHDGVLEQYEPGGWGPASSDRLVHGRGAWPHEPPA